MDGWIEKDCLSVPRLVKEMSSELKLKMKIIAIAGRFILSLISRHTSLLYLVADNVVDVVAGCCCFAQSARLHRRKAPWLI